MPTAEKSALAVGNCVINEESRSSCYPTVFLIRRIEGARAIAEIAGELRNGRIMPTWAARHYSEVHLNIAALRRVD